MYLQQVLQQLCQTVFTHSITLFSKSGVGIASTTWGIMSKVLHNVFTITTNHSYTNRVGEETKRHDKPAT